MKPLIVLATTTVCSLSLTITSPVVFNAHLVDLQRALVNTTLVYTNTTVDSFASNCKLKLTTHDLVAIEMKDINSIKDCLVELPSDKSLTVDSVMLNTGYHDGILMALPWHVYHTGFFLNNQFSSTLDVPKALSNLHNLNSEIDGLALDSSDDGMMTLFSELSHSNYTDFERVFAGLLQIRKYINETDEPFSKFKLNKTMMAYDKLVNPETTGLNYSITSFCSDSHNHSISVIDGLYIGVYKYSRNINQSMDALNALTSVEYQRSLSADLQLGQHWTTPIYKSLWDGNCF